MLVWETIENQTKDGANPVQLYRAKVPGGWLVLFKRNPGDNVVLSSLFYPDPNHIWDGDALE